MNNDTVRRLVELLRLERNRPPEFADGGRSAAAWLDQVRALEAELRDNDPDVWARLVGPRAEGKQRCES